MDKRARMTINTQSPTTHTNHYTCCFTTSSRTRCHFPFHSSQPLRVLLSLSWLALRTLHSAILERVQPFCEPLSQSSSSQAQSPLLFASFAPNPYASPFPLRPVRGHTHTVSRTLSEHTLSSRNILRTHHSLLKSRALQGCVFRRAHHHRGDVMLEGDRVPLSVSVIMVARAARSGRSARA